MKINPIYFQKKLLNKNKNTLIKSSNRYIQERKSMKKIFDNISYMPSDNTNNFGIYKKNNGSTIRLLKEYYNNNTIDVIGKENNLNKNNVSTYSTLTEDTDLNFNLYNKFLTINQNDKNQSNNYMAAKRYLSPINKLNYKLNIDNSKYDKTNDNNSISNDSTFDNTNLNQIYNYSYFSSSNSNNNYLFESPSLNNNIQSYPNLKIRIDLNEIDSQNQITNNSAFPSNYSYLNLSNEYKLNNNLSYSYNAINSNYDGIPLNFNQSFYQNQISSNASIIGDLNLNNIINLKNHTNTSLDNDININDDNNIEINNYNYNSNIISSELTSEQKNDNNNSKILNDMTKGFNNNTINSILKDIINDLFHILLCHEL